MVQSSSPSNSLLATYLLLGSDAILFSGCLGAAIVLHAVQPNQIAASFGLGAWPQLATLLLTTGSFCLLGFHRTAATNPRASRGLAHAVAGIGILFLLMEGLMAQRLVVHGVLLRTTPYNTLLYALLVYQAVHVLVGIGFLWKVAHTIAPLLWHWVTCSWFILFLTFFLRH